MAAALHEDCDASRATKCGKVRFLVRSNSDGGFVQVAVLLGLAVVAGLLTATMTLSTTTSRSASAYERLVVSELAGLSAAQRLVAALADLGDDFEQRALDGVETLDLGPLRVAVQLEAESSKINLLHGREELVERLLQQIAPPAELSQWRTALQAAQDSSDAEAAIDLVEAAWGQSGGDNIRGDVTTLGIASGIDPTYASETALRSIPDVSAVELARYAALAPEARRTERLNSAYVASPGRLYALHASSGGAGQPDFSVRIYFEVTTAGKPIILSGVTY